MANISKAKGTMTFYANSVDELKKLTTIFMATNRWEYGIYANDNVDFSTIYDTRGKDGIFKETLSKTDLVASYALDVVICGCGCWTFANSIRSLGEGLSTEEPSEKFDYRQIEKIEFALGFDVIDYEPACEYLARDKILLYHKKNTSLTDNLIPLIDNENVYEITIENLVKLLEILQDIG